MLGFYRGCTGIMEKNMETTGFGFRVRLVGFVPFGVALGLYWGCIGIMQNKMETSI